MSGKLALQRSHNAPRQLCVPAIAMDTSTPTRPSQSRLAAHLGERKSEQERYIQSLIIHRYQCLPRKLAAQRDRLYACRLNQHLGLEALAQIGALVCGHSARLDRRDESLDDGGQVL